MGDVYQQVPVSSAFGSDSPLQAAMQLSKNTNDMLNVLQFWVGPCVEFFLLGCHLT